MATMVHIVIFVRMHSGPCSGWIAIALQRRLDTRHRTRDYFAFHWSVIASETGVDHAK